jgi:hypothetical protein
MAGTASLAPPPSQFFARRRGWGKLSLSYAVVSLCFRSSFGRRWWYRYVCAVGGVFNILLMMGADLIGLVLGVDGTQYFAQELVSSWDANVSLGNGVARFADNGVSHAGIRFLFVACACLFVGVQLV